MKSVSLGDMASRAQVSIVTASRAMNGRSSVRSYIRERVAAAATELGYKPNLIARAMATRMLNVVSLSVFQLHNPFFGQLATDLSAYLKAAGFQCVFCDSTQELHEFNATRDLRSVANPSRGLRRDPAAEWNLDGPSGYQRDRIECRTSSSAPTERRQNKRTDSAVPKGA